MIQSIHLVMNISGIWLDSHGQHPNQMRTIGVLQCAPDGHIDIVEAGAALFLNDVPGARIRPVVGIVNQDAQSDVGLGMPRAATKDLHFLCC